MLDDFTRVLRFKPHLLVLDAGPDTLFVIDEFKRTMLSGEIYVRIAACVRERMAIERVFAELSATFSDLQVLAALDHLVRIGCLRADEPDDCLDRARGYFERTGADGDDACARTVRLAVAVEAFGADAGPQVDALTACGIRVERDAPLTIAVCDSYDRPQLTEAVARITERGGAVLLVVQEGGMPMIGPLLAASADARSAVSEPKSAQPQAGSAHDEREPCIECVRHWTTRNRPVETLLARYHPDAAVRMPPAHTRASIGAVSALVAAFVEQLAASDERRRHARSHIVAVRLDTFATAHHRVVRRPQCPRCGNPHWMREQAQRPPELSGVPASSQSDGGYRTRDPLAVFERYRHLVSAVSGAVAYLHPMPGRHAGMRKVYVSGYLSCPGSVPRGNRFDKICSGKGRTDEQARASALCEALERFSGVFQGDEAVRRASFAALAADERAGTPVHVNALQQFSDAQFEQRDAINARTDDVRKQVPPRFDIDRAIDWTPAWSIVSGQRYWVPLAYCYADVPERGDPSFCIHNPNGSAAGSCIDEAILQGLLELVERDAAAIWWYNRIERPGVELASFADPYFDALQAEYQAMGWRLWALDITHDLRIPVIVALAENPATGRFSIGFGCHPDGRIAVQRALTEVNQLLDVTSSGPPPWDHAKLSSARFLYPARDIASVDVASGPRDARSCLADAIADVVGRISAAGLDVLVVDKTRPDIGLAVVQAIVPGLCHFWPRFGARRLYSVPVEMGWVGRARDEQDLNRVLLFL